MTMAVCNMFTCIMLACVVQIQCPGISANTETTTAKADRGGAQLAKDYDYVDLGTNYRPTNTRTNLNTGNTNTNPQGSVPNQFGTPTLAEKHEWLVSRLKTMKQRASPIQQLRELQNLFPGINVTKVYHSLLARPSGEDDAEGRKARYGNVTYSEDEMESHYVNGTLQPGEGPEMDDAYYYNGTWYPGVREAEDGHYVNGTWIPAPGENDEGHIVNGTWHGEAEEEEAGGKEEEEENEKGDLMWWQLHHPKWRNEGAYEVNNPKTSEQEQQKEKETGSLIPIIAPIPVPRNPSNFQNPNQEPKRPFASPQYQRPPQNQRPPNSQPRVHSPGATQQRAPTIENNPTQAKMTGNSGAEPMAAAVDNMPLHSKGHQQTGQQKLPEPAIVETIPQKGKGMSSTMTWGIVMACLIAFTFILAPLACILYKYRMEKRVKKRTFLKRPEHGSVDEGIMDAMVMSELGETSSSRIKMIGKRSSPRPKRDDRARDPSSRRSSASSMSLSRMRHERRPLTMVEMGDGPEILIV